MPKWVTRTYTYTEPVFDSDAQPESVTLRGAGSKSEFDAGFDAGYRAGWVAGYGVARHGNGEVIEHDLAAEGTGESPSFLL